MPSGAILHRDSPNLNMLAPSLQLRREDDDEDGCDRRGRGIRPAPRLLLESLPADVLLLVLVRLPFSVLLRFRSVCRSWCEHLSSYEFWILWFKGNSNPNPQSISISALSHNRRQLQSAPNPHQNPNQNLLNFNPNDIRNPNPQNAVANPNLIQPYPIHNNMIHPNPIQHNPNPLPFRNLKPLQDLDRIISNFNPNPNGPPIPCLLLCSVQFKASPGYQPTPISVCYVLQKNAASKRSYWSWLHKSFMQVQGPYIILASDGGLLLLLMCGEGSQQLMVCNPLLKAKKVLPYPIFPLLADISATATGFIVDEERGEYRVLLSGSGCQVYHSSTGKWQVIRKTYFEDPLSASPPMLDGSIFWLSAPKMSINSNNESLLSVYHPREEVLTCVNTHFPRGVSFSNHGRVWKDAQGLQTLAGRSTWFGTWKLDNGHWKSEKKISSIYKNHNLSDLDYVKVDNLLFFRVSRFNQVLIFDFGLNKVCVGVAPCCANNLERLTGHCVFQPSCMQV